MHVHATSALKNWLCSRRECRSRVWDVRVFIHPHENSHNGLPTEIVQGANVPESRRKLQLQNVDPGASGAWLTGTLSSNIVRAENGGFREPKLRLTIENSWLMTRCPIFLRLPSVDCTNYNFRRGHQPYPFGHRSFAMSVAAERSRRDPKINRLNLATHELCRHDALPGNPSGALFWCGMGTLHTFTEQLRVGSGECSRNIARWRIEQNGLSRNLFEALRS